MSARQKLVWGLGIAVVCGLAMPPFWLGVARGATFVAALVALTVVREIGRLLAGTAVGLTPAIVELGEGDSVLRFRIRGVLWDVRKLPIVSFTAFAPPTTDAWLRARVAVLLLARPAVTLGVLLAVRALGAPLFGGGEGIRASLLGSVATVAEALLLLGLAPFSLTGLAIVPFESDGLQLAKLTFAKRADLGQAFARYYAACAMQAIKDEDPARAVDACRAGQQRFGPPWTDAFRNLETVALSRMGDTTDARAKTEQDLARELRPAARALALNNWSWFAFVARDEKALRLADRRSADALVLLPEQPAVVGTRGTVLLWQGRVAEAVPLLEKSRNGAADRRGHDTNTCLLAMAYAARGQSALAQAELGRVKNPAATEGLWAEAERRVRAAAEPAQIVRAARGHRALVVKGDGVELHDGDRVRRLASPEIEAIEVRPTARGRAQLSLRHDGRRWRLPLDPSELAWTRMLIGGSVVVAPGGGPGTAKSPSASVAAQERAYAEYVAAQRTSVSSPKAVLFVASAIAFAASMLISTSWQWLAVIMPVIFVHELGHWLAMRAFGHRDARISFIPFFGAATFTKDPFEKPWQEVVMLLAGPVPGLALGVALLLLPAIPHVDAATVRSLAIMAVIVNAGNLLPFHPLDGGRIVHALVTAGRPRLDLVFKSVATLAFLAGAVAAKDFVLGSIAAVGVIGWRNTFRLARLEERIRRTPGFDPRLSVGERRGFIFRTLAEEPSGQAQQWGATVAALDMPLGYRRAHIWRAIAAALVLLAIVGGGLWMAKLYRSTFSRMHCPSPAGAAPLSCAGAPNFADVDWKPGPGRARGAAPPTWGEIGEGGHGYALSAFVWCRAAEDRDADVAKLARELREAAAGASLCAALPWEALPPEPAASAATRAKARWTFEKLRYLGHLHGPHGLEYLDRQVRELRPPEALDADVIRLAREMVAAPRGSAAARDARDKLADRVGRSPTESCKRIAIANVDVDAEGFEDADAGSAAADEESRLRFSIGASTPADFAPLAGYLCDHGCRIDVLPVDPEDQRLQLCF